MQQFSQTSDKQYPFQAVAVGHCDIYTLFDMVTSLGSPKDVFLHTNKNQGKCGFQNIQQAM